MIDQSMELSKPLSIVELEALPEPRPQQIIDTIHDYADSSAAIRAIAVTAAIERANPSERQLLDMQEAAVKGIVAHTTRPDGKRPFGCSDETLRVERDEYSLIAGFVGIELEDRAKPQVQVL